jgi:hypothetical protein
MHARTGARSGDPPPGSRKEILVRIQELANKPSMNDVKADLEDLDKRVRKTADKDKDLRR